jgi:cytochrome c553
MFRTLFNITTCLAVMLLFAPTLYAGDSPEEIKLRIGTGDPLAGQVKSLICQACHGKEGSPAKPDCPKLAGQYAVFR